MTQNKRGLKSSSPAFLISMAAHLFLAFFVAYKIHSSFADNKLPDTEFEVSTLEIKEQTARRFNHRKTRPNVPRPPDPLTKTPKPPSAAHQSIIAPTPGNATTDVVSQDIEAVSEIELGPALTTDADLPSAPSALEGGPAQPSPAAVTRSASTGRNPSRAPARVKGGSLDNLRHNILAEVSNISPSALTQLMPDNQLGAVLVENESGKLSGHIRLIRIKHSLSDWWQDPTAMNSLIEWLDKNTELRADMRFEGGALKLDDDRILDAPFLIMTGHDKDITAGRQMARGGPLVSELSDAERQNLREYLVDRKGTLFFDDCGFNGVFAAQIQRELKKIMPEHDLVDLPHNHEVYSVFYELAGPPEGGDVFWGSENVAQASKFKTHKAIVIDGRIAVLFNRKDYMCAMETVEVKSRTMLRMRRSTDVYRFMTNLFIYAMKYGGNVQRYNNTTAKNTSTDEPPPENP